MSLPVCISARPRFGEFSFKTYEHRAGPSIDALAALVEADMPGYFRATGLAIVNDNLPLPPSEWARYVPKEGDSVFFVILPAKGGQTLQIIASVAVLAAQTAAYMIPGIGPFLSLAIGVGGSFLIGALAPDAGGKKPKVPKQLGSGGFSGNELSPYEQLSMVLGAKRVPAPFLAPPLTFLENENAFGVAIVGLAGRTELSQPFCEGSPIEVLEENMQEGEAADADPVIYTQTVWQEPGREFATHVLKNDTTNNERWTLDHSPDDASVFAYDLPKFQWFRLGNKALPREVHFDLRFDQGLYRTTGNERGGCAFQIVLRKPGQPDIYLPEIHCHALVQTPIRARIIVAFYADNLSAGTSASAFWWLDYANTSAQSAEGFSAHTYYGTGNNANHVDNKTAAGGGNDQTVVIFADPEEMTELRGVDGLGWSIGIRQGSGYFENRITQATNTYAYNGGAAVNGAWFTRHTPGGGVDRTLEDQSKVQTHCVLEQVSRYFSEQPIRAGDFAYYECRTKNQRVDQITVMARRYVGWLWNRAAQAWEPISTLSRNPGAILYDHCLNPNPLINAIPLNAGKVDAAEMGAFYEYCEDRGLECNGYVTPGANWWDIYKEICEAGMGRAKASQRYGVYIEKNRIAESPVQVFSPRNSANFQVEKQYDRKPHAFRVTFDDREDNYQTSPELLVAAPGYSIDGVGGTMATLFESRHYAFITDAEQARARATIELRIIWYRDKAYSFETDMRWLRSPRGSLVAISQYVLDAAHGWAAIRNVAYADVGGTTMIQGLYLDMEVDLQPATTGIVIQALDGTLIAAQTTMTRQNRFIRFSTPIANNPEIAPGAHIIIGAVGSEYVRCIVDDVIPLDQGSARVICYDEAPQIWQ